MRPRWHKVISDLLGSKTRSLLVIASIGVGLYAVGLIANMYVINNQDMRTGFGAVNPANIYTFTSTFDADLVDHVRQVSGVGQAEGVFSFTLRVRGADGQWTPIHIQALPDIATRQINRLKLKEGQWPPADRELAVEIFKSSDLPVGVGGELELELPSGKTRRIKLVGLVNDQTVGSTDSGGFFLAPVQGYITMDTLEWLEMPRTMNLLLSTVDANSTDPAHIRQVSNAVTRAVEQSGRTVYSAGVRASDNHPNRVYVEAISAVLFVLGFLVVFLSGFLITNTLSSLLNQQVHQIGVMKTIGASRWQIASIYMIQIFFFGLVAFAIAQPLSSISSYYLLDFVSGAVNVQLQGYRTIQEVVWLQLALALIVPQAAGFIPILQGTNVTAVEALSGYNQTSTDSSGWVSRQLQKIRSLPRPVTLSLRNTFRRRGRLILTLFTLTLGGAVFMATLNTQGALISYIDQIGRYFLADVTLTLKESNRVDRITALLEEDPGVAEVEAWTAASADLILADGSTGERFGLLAPPANSPFVKAVVLEGRWMIPEDQNAIVVNERFREIFPNLKPGDTIQAKIAGKTTDLVVVGFFQLTGKSGGYLAYTPYDFLSRQLHQANRASAYRIRAAKPNTTEEEQEALGRRLEQLLEAHDIEVAEVETGHSLTTTTADGLNILTTLMLILALLTAVVGSIGLTGTMSMNVMDRTREIGIIRTIGASDRAVMNSVMIEGVLIGLMSWILSVLASIPITSLMSNAIIMALFGAAAKFIFNPLGVILWLVIVLILSAISSVMPARKAASLTIREVLSYE
ncbi:MAG TPA: FtsX-like permease family protein [Anaerolineaceae bacterium]|nr:FtsX-like permease family protein [Anaerolineaceae bacterium]HPN50942.1 FtsX-like permease family protein [Anaerolineaceae bacterium]